jgi:hypothetical protein
MLASGAYWNKLMIKASIQIPKIANGKTKIIKEQKIILC